MPRDDERLDDIRDASLMAMRFLDGRQRQDLLVDEVLAAALTQKIIVIGEAAGAVTSATKRRLPDVPWQLMIGMQNVVVHAYWEIDRGELWRTVTEDLPAVIKALDAEETD
ncbi:MAG: HepT-like ribonuclease domain-containing protein [Candidatus Limnocylindria bacterium]